LQGIVRLMQLEPQLEVKKTEETLRQSLGMEYIAARFESQDPV
jgi:hypothetical protein